MASVYHENRNIYYECSGTGLPVVLLHSFLCNGEMWSAQLAPLAEHYRVINIDIRGHGQSGAADRPLDIYDLVGDVLAVLDAEGIDSATWAGLSIGGMIALRAALTAPERVSGLILLDSHAGTETRFKKFKYRTMVATARLFGIEPLLPKVAKLMFGRHTLQTKPDLVEHWKHQFAAMSLVSIDNICGALCRRDSLKMRLAEIAQPVLVLVGQEDVSLPPPCSEALARRLPNATLEVIPRAGHLSTLEQPAAVTQSMLHFLHTHCRYTRKQNDDQIRTS